MRSGNLELKASALVYTGVYSYGWSGLARLESVYAYYFYAYYTTVNTFGNYNRYFAFPDDPMCGAGMLICMNMFYGVLILKDIIGLRSLVIKCGVLMLLA